MTAAVLEVVQAASAAPHTARVDLDAIAWRVELTAHRLMRFESRHGPAMDQHGHEVSVVSGVAGAV